MSTISAPKYLASGYSVQESDGKLYLINHHTSGFYVIGYIIALFTFILGINSLVIPFFLYSEGENYLLAAAILFPLTLVASAALFWIRKTVMSRHRRPIAQCDVLAIIDLQKRSLLERDGRLLSSLDDVHLQKQLQLTSSAPSFALVWPEGKRTIVRGNAFAGGNTAVVNALRQHGIRQK